MKRTRDGLAFEVAGSGPAVLLIHAGIADHAMWDPQWERWRETFTLIRYDQRGFGESEDPTGPFSRHDDAASVLDAAETERVHVVGASMGGRAALDLALVSPERVGALVTVASTPSGWAHADDLVAAFLAVDETYAREGIEAANELELRIWVDGPRREAAAVDASVRERVARMNRAVLEREAARERAGTDIEDADLDPPAVGRLDAVDATVLVVTGEHDQPSVNAGAAAIAAGVTGASAIEIPGAAHLPSMERPDVFDQAVRPFLQSAA